MKCSTCQFDNPENMLFCGGCGAKLEHICPECNSSNPPQFRFCGKCGDNLATPPDRHPEKISYEAKLDKIRKYLPKGLAEKVLAQKEKIEGERKQVSVMFCDLEGFTGVSERLGPEKMYGLMDLMYDILIDKVKEYEGTVNEMTGDGIMALFGAPIALEDAPQRAIRAGMAIHREMAKFSDKYKDEHIPQFKMRIGIHTGPVVVGSLGNDLRVEFKAVGNTVNLASRMEGLAEPGTTYVTEDTFNLTEGLFRFEALGEKRIKGKKDPVNVYRVIATSSRRTRFDVSAERGLTPFIGKRRELDILLDGFEMTKSGKGRSFSIVAEAGVGKSRLLYEFRKAVANEDMTFLEGKCLSYGRNISYHPIIDMLKSTFNIEDDDIDEDIRQKVTSSLNTFGIDTDSALPYFLEFMSVSGSGIENIAMSPEGKKAQIIKLLNRIAHIGSERRPLIMIVEDLHWIDSSSEDVLKNILSNIPGTRILLIFTYRTEYTPPWSGKSYHGQITLNRFSNRECQSMLNHLLDMDDLHIDFKEMVFDKTGGIPYFIEELIISLRINAADKNDLSSIVRGDHIVKIPATIQDVIMSRVDRLPERSKEILQYGAVIGREFKCELLNQLMNLSEKELIISIDILKNSELIYERGIFPESTYIHKHALTQEVVYDSILSKKKKRLHEGVGIAIEKLYKKNIDEYYEILTEHFIKSENYAKGAEYSDFSSKKAVKTASLPYAIASAEKRIVCLERLPQNDDVQKKIIDTKTAIGLNWLSLNFNIKAKEAVAPVVELALERGYKKRICQIYTIIGSYNWYIEEDIDKAIMKLEEALNISMEVNDFFSMASASIWLGVFLAYNCEFKKASSHLQRSLDICIAGNSLWGVTVCKGQFCYFIYGSEGKIEQSLKTSQEMIRVAQESGDIFSKAYAYINYGNALYGMGFFEQSIHHFLKGIDFCERINLFAVNTYANHLLGDIYYEIGDYQKALDHYNKSVRLLQNNRLLPSFMKLNIIGAEMAKVMNKGKDIDISRLYEYANENKIKLYDGKMRRYIVELLLNYDKKYVSDAEHLIKQAIEADSRNGMVMNLSKDYALYADLLKRKCDKSNAREHLIKAIEILKNCDAAGWVEKYEKEIAAL